MKTLPNYKETCALIEARRQNKVHHIIVQYVLVDQDLAHIHYSIVLNYATDLNRVQYQHYLKWKFEWVITPIRNKFFIFLVVFHHRGKKIEIFPRVVMCYRNSSHYGFSEYVCIRSIKKPIPLPLASGAVYFLHCLCINKCTS